MINSIYHAVDDPERPKSHNTGTPAAVGSRPPTDGLLMIQGPLLITRSGPLARPRVENGNLAARQPPSADRLCDWLRARVAVQDHDQWLFIKLHTHGAQENNAAVLLGPAMRQFHQSLQEFSTKHGFQFFYVTAREMAQLVAQAERGLSLPDFDALGWE